MKKIYIILMHTRTIPAKLIKFATKYEYSHVGLSLEESCEEIYSFGRRKATSIINSGFTVEHKGRRIFSKIR